MDQATHRVPPGFVWPTVGHPGQVPLWALVPTPGQPRLDFNELELGALAETMKAKNGGRQREIVKVRELTPKEKKSGIYPAQALYMIKSGERRCRAAQLAGLEMLQIWVEKYDSEEEEDVDTFMLNECRVGLTYYENASWLAKMIVKHGWKTQAEISKRLGKDLMWVSDHMAFSKLHSSVQERMNPELFPAENDRYKRETGVFFARFDETVQLDLHNNMPANCRTIPAQIGWMNQYLTRKGIQVPMRGREPRKIRELVSSYADYTQRKAVAFVAASDFGRLFENATEVQKNDLLGKLGDAEYEFNELLKRVRKLAGVEEALAPERPKPASTVTMVPGVAAVHARGVALAAAAAKAAPVQERAPAKPAPKQKEEEPRSPPLVYMNKMSRWVRGVTVPLSQYIELWEAERLEFQFLERDKPKELPTLEQAKARLAQFRKKSK